MILNVGLLRLGVAAVMILVFAWLGWRIFSDTIGLNLASSAPAEALEWAPDTQLALNVLAQRELIKTNADLDAAEAWASRALRTNPLNQQALFLLGAIAEKRGDRDKANILIREAGARSWRNLGVQLWLFQQNAIQKDFGRALVHADALFRVEPRYVATVFPVIAAFTIEPAGLKALTDFLATNPPWRQWVVVSLAQQLYDKSNLDQIFAQLARTDKPPTPPELKAYLFRLIRDRRYYFAYERWRESLPEQMKDGGVPYNGDFEFPADGQPFNWTLGSTPGVDVQIVPADGARGDVLRAQFSGARVTFKQVVQHLLLKPGRHRLTGRVKAERLRTERGLWWQVSCVIGTKATLAHTKLVSGTMDWSEFQVDFEVPFQDCDAQEIRLELPARIASEHEIEGQVWYEHLRIDPIPAAGAAGTN